DDTTGQPEHGPLDLAGGRYRRITVPAAGAALKCGRLRHACCSFGLTGCDRGVNHFHCVHPCSTHLSINANLPNRSYEPCARRALKPFGPVVACATCCWAKRPRITTLPPTPRRRKCASCSATNARSPWEPSSV